MFPRINYLIYSHTVTLLLLVCQSVSADEQDDRNHARSRLLNLFFGFYTFGLIAFAVLGILMALSLIGIDVFRKLRAIRPIPVSRYESF